MFDKNSYETSQLGEIENMLEEFESIAFDSEPATRPKISFSYKSSGVMVDPYVELVNELPTGTKPRNRSNEEPTSLQTRQASEIYEELIRQRVTPEEALDMLGPLANAARKYRTSFSFKEVKTGLPATGYCNDEDRAFMAPISCDGIRWE
jgi:hypothetical protein